MKLVATLAALLGLAAGLLFGLLLWRSSDLPAAPIVAARADVQVLEELRLLREAVDSQSRAARLGTREGPGEMAVAAVQSLNPDAAVTLEQLKVALDGVLAELRDLRETAGGGLANVEVSPDATAQISAAHELARKDGNRLQVEMLTPRDIYQRFGKPSSVDANAKGLVWTWVAGIAGEGQTSPLLQVTFVGGYVVSVDAQG